MTDDLRSVPRQKSPGAAEILPIFPMATALAGPWHLLSGPPRVDWAIWLAFVLAGAAVFGVPMLFWCLDHGRTRLRWLSTLGAIAGSLSMSAVLAIGLLSCLLQGGRRYTEIALEQGAPLAMAGIVPWSAFITDLLQAVLVGGLTGLSYWVVFVRADRRR
jgi:hypothetical protein